jgi:DNA-binding response OmpR family regulator
MSLVSIDTGSAKAGAAQVIIVDDNEDAAMSLTMLLDLEDIPSLAAPDAESALRLVEQSAPPLLLIDIGLPGMNGFELAKRLRELPTTRNATLIALTGREVSADRGETVGMAFDQYWTKPFDPKQLLAEVKAIIGRRDR